MALIHAYRTDNGELVQIPESHLQIFPGVFTREPPTEPDPDTEVAAAPAAPALDVSSDLTPPRRGDTKENH